MATLNWRLLPDLRSGSAEFSIVSVDDRLTERPAAPAGC
jgi:hypothetical protein